ncbi:MAG TPA: copper resistance CopC family protein [Steroidobacteraceae bacterium]
MKQITGAVMLALALLPLGAEAHAHLLQSTPADGSELTQAPASFTLQFNEPARLTALSIKKDAEPPHRLDPPANAPSARWVVAAPALAPGSYTLSYRVLSDDSHIVSGSIQFRVREP